MMKFNERERTDNISKIKPHKITETIYYVDESSSKDHKKGKYDYTYDYAEETKSMKLEIPEERKYYDLYRRAITKRQHDDLILDL